MNKLIETLEPEFGIKIGQLIPRVEKITGLTWCVTSGRRTIAEQDELFAQGRTKPGGVVTKAKGGQSPHNFGLAADLAPMKDGEIWWEAPKKIWQQMADEAVNMGLVAGYYFRTIFDAPHVEDPNWKAVQADWKAGKIKVA